MARPTRASNPAASGFIRFTLDVPAGDHAKFKAICALSRTSMSREINLMIASHLEDPDPSLTEALYLRVSPELKRAVLDYAKQRKIRLVDLLIEAFGQLRREQEPIDMEVRGNYGPPRPARGRPRLGRQMRRVVFGA